MRESDPPPSPCPKEMGGSLSASSWSGSSIPTRVSETSASWPISDTVLSLEAFIRLLKCLRLRTLFLRARCLAWMMSRRTLTGSKWWSSISRSVVDNTWPKWSSWGCKERDSLTFLFCSVCCLIITHFVMQATCATGIYLPSSKQNYKGNIISSDGTKHDTKQVCLQCFNPWHKQQILCKIKFSSQCLVHNSR